MTALREAAQRALEALEYAQQGRECPSTTRQAITALRAALAQQKDPTDPGNDVDVLREHVRHLERRVRQLHAQQAEPAQEPVAWNWMLDGLPYGRACYGDPPDADIAERAATAGRTVRLLYAAPPQRKQAESVQMHPSQFAELIKGKETMIGVPVYWSEWPNKERT